MLNEALHANENICTFSHVFRPTCVWINFPVTWWLLSSIHSWWQFLIQLQSGLYTVTVCPFFVLSAHSRLRTLIFFCSRCIHLTSVSAEPSSSAISQHCHGSECFLSALEHLTFCLLLVVNSLSVWLFDGQLYLKNKIERKKRNSQLSER